MHWLFQCLVWAVHSCLCYFTQDDCRSGPNDGTWSDGAEVSSSTRQTRQACLPRFLRLRDAPAYVGMDRNRFNAAVRPCLTEIPIGRQGIAFDRLELDAWAEEHKTAQRASRPTERRAVNGTQKGTGPHPDGTASGTSTNASAGVEFAKALERLSLKKRSKFLARLMEEVRQAKVYGVRPVRTFEQAAIRFVQEHQHKRSIDSDVGRLKALMPLLGPQPLDRIHIGSLAAVDRSTKEGGSQRRHCQSRAQGRPPHPEPRGNGVDGRIRAHVAGSCSENPAITRYGQATALSTSAGTSKRDSSGIAGTSGEHGFVCREHRVSGQRDLRAQWDWEVRVPEFEDQRVHHSGSACEERRRAARGAESHRGIGRERAARPTPGARVCPSGQAREPHAERRLASREGTGGSAAGAGARPQAHVWSPATGGRRELRGQAGLAGPLLRADHDALLGRRALETDRGSEPVCDRGTNERPELVVLRRLSAS